MKLSDLYAEYFANWVSDGTLVNRDRISLLGIKPLYDRYVTTNMITQVWMITGVPVHFNVNLIYAIRNIMYESYPEVRTIVHLNCEPVNVNARSDMFTRQLKYAARNYEQYKDVFSQLSDAEQLAGATEINPVSGAKITVDRQTLERIKDNYDSYTYVYSASTDGLMFANTRFFIQASCDNKRTLAKYKRKLTDLMTKHQVSIREVHGSVGQYLSNFCPATYNKGNTTKFPSMLMSEENLAAIVPNKTDGLINEDGVMCALDWKSKLPFSIDFFNSGSAQIIMIIARSGFGKTLFSFVLATMLSGYGVHWSAIDIKGGEWVKVGRYVKLLEISMSGANARFVNTMRLDDIECSQDDCAEFYDSAIQGTCDMFEIATNLDAREGNVTDLRAILNESVTKYFVSNGVQRDNPKTFSTTKTFKYADILQIISELEMASSYTQEQKKICKLIRTRTAPFFMGEGRYASAFVNELTVGEVLNTPGVIYSFNKNQDEQLDTLDSIRVYMSQFLDGKKHSIRRRNGLHTAAFYEELQRSSHIGKLVESISQKVTGSRSNNLTVFLLLNAVSTFKGPEFAAIKSNITTKIVGKVLEDDAKTLIDEFDCKLIKDYIYDICTDISGEYQNCFAIQYDTGVDQNKAIIKSVMPEEMLKAFATRTSMKDTEEADR